MILLYGEAIRAPFFGTVGHATKHVVNAFASSNVHFLPPSRHLVSQNFVSMAPPRRLSLTDALIPKLAFSGRNLKVVRSSTQRI